MQPKRSQIDRVDHKGYALAVTLAQIPIVLFYRNGSTLCRAYVDDQYAQHNAFDGLKWKNIDFPRKEQMILLDLCTALHGSDEVTDTTARFNVV